MFFRLLIFVIIISFACSQSGDEDSIENSDNAPNPTNYCERIYNDVKNQIKRKKKAETKAGGKKKSGVDTDAVRNFAFQQIEANLDNDYDAMLDSAVDFLLTLSSAAPIPFAGEISKVLAFAWKLFRKKQKKEKKEPTVEEAVTAALDEQEFRHWKNDIAVLKIKIQEVIDNSCRYYADKSSTYNPEENYNAMNNIPIIQFGISLEEKFCADQGEKVDTNIQRCLLLANMYADVQILHQIAIACYKMANANPAKKSAEKRESSREELLNDKLDKLLKRDIEVLSFLMNLPPGSIEVGGQQIHIFAKLYSNPIAYQSLKTYLDVLLKKNSTKLKAYAFSEKGLKGRRTLRTPGSYATLGYNVHSLFVPHDTYIYLYHMNNYKGSISGPYFGPAMYEVVRSPGIWSSLKVFSTKNRDARKMLRICGEPDLKGECIALRIYNTYDLKLIKSGTGVYSSAWGSDKYECREENGRQNRCERADLPLIDYWSQTYDGQKDEFYCSINGSRQNWDCFRGNDWTWRVRSMVIPLGYTMQVHQDSSALNKQYLTNMKGWYGPYTGPQVAAELQWFTDRLRLDKTDSSKLQIRVCTKPNLRGQCGEVTIDQRKAEQTGGFSVDLKPGINKIPFTMGRLFEQPWHNMGYSPDGTYLRSMKIPDGYLVENNDVMPYEMTGYMADIAIPDDEKKMTKFVVRKLSAKKAKKIKQKENSSF